ncbi:hypothetical protein Plhal304r1_c063g0150491 [Plasmopara halstedii]
MSPCITISAQDVSTRTFINKFNSNNYAHVVDRETTPTFRTRDEYVKSNKFAFGLTLLNMNVDYHHAFDNCRKARIAWTCFGW